MLISTHSTTLELHSESPLIKTSSNVNSIWNNPLKKKTSPLSEAIQLHKQKHTSPESVSSNSIPKFHSRDLEQKIDVHSKSLLPSSSSSLNYVPQETRELIFSVVGNLPSTDFPDLKYRSPEEIRRQMNRVFQELPAPNSLTHKTEFDNQYRNPCWKFDQNLAKEGGFYLSSSHEDMTCLPFAYILGQPKCGTSDLFERLKLHPQIRMPKRKEVRWFTRGEFTLNRMEHEDEIGKAHGREQNYLLGPESSVFSFTNHFSSAIQDILHSPQRNLIAIDGGPHTFWWPTQSPDGSLFPEDIPYPQLLHEMQPESRLILTLSDPVRRLYSDYYFLEDNMRPVKRQREGGGGKSEVSTKSPQQFHERVVLKINEFNSCVDEKMKELKQQEQQQQQQHDQEPQHDHLFKSQSDHSEEEAVQKAQWFRASQICAHDRHRFATAGYGRLSIGLYVLYLEKWLEYFPTHQFYLVRLEDYDSNKQEYMKRLFEFLGVEVNSLTSNQWEEIMEDFIANENPLHRDPILPETESLLREFHRPYNNLLSDFLLKMGIESGGGEEYAEGFKWSEYMEEGQSLRDHQLRLENGDNAISLTTTIEEEQREGGQGGEGGGNEEHHHPHEKREIDHELNHPSPLIGDRDHHQLPSDLLGLHTGGDFDFLTNAENNQRVDSILSKTKARPRPTGQEDENQNQHPPPIDMNLLNRERMNQHGIHRHFIEEHNHINNNQLDDHHLPPLPGMNANQNKPMNLRGGGGVRGERITNSNNNQEVGSISSAIFHPFSFSLEGLPMPETSEFNEWLSDRKIIPLVQSPQDFDEKNLGLMLCAASFGLDLAAVKYLLYDMGVDGNVLNHEDAKRNAFYCLALVSSMMDGHPRSHVFALLKGTETWLTPYINPPLPTKLASVLSRDVIDGLNESVLKIAQWLHRAGTDPNVHDVAQNTPLHQAAAGGMVGLTKFLLEVGADPNAQNNEERTPMHYAAAAGHAEVLSILMHGGGDIDLKDQYAATPRDIASNPGPILPEDALAYLGITQNPVRRIERLIHPENHPDTPRVGWKHGTGGWGPERLPGYETDLECSVDQFFSDEITGQEIFERYIARNSPVLIRGLLEDWPAVTHYTKQSLLDNFSHLSVDVSDIPYSIKFGGAGEMEMSLKEYIQEVEGHRIKGGTHPWYVFVGHPVPFKSEGEDSLVPKDWCPTPEAISEAFTVQNRGVTSREQFINAQWALGGEGTGAPVHYHNTAWAALAYGAKKWMIYPPHFMIMSNRQIREYTETDLLELQGVGEKGERRMKEGRSKAIPHTCVQMAGDVMIIPESWGHGVLNIQETIAVASESKGAHWRMKPGTGLIRHLPFDNRKFM